MVDTKPTKQGECAEAICGALHELGFEFLGDSNGIASTWFRRGDWPKAVRIEVLRSALAPMVIVNVEYPNISKPGLFLLGRSTLQIDVDDGQTMGQIEAATEEVVVRCLEILRDVVSGEGVASLEAIKDLDHS